MTLLQAAIVFGAKYLVFLIALIAMAFWLMLPNARKWDVVKVAVVALPLAFILSRLAGMAYYDPRPFVSGHFVPLIPHAPDNGFPSDHALLGSAVAALTYLFNRKLSLALWVLVLLVGASRVAAGIHSPIDILGSMVIAVLATWAANAVERTFSARPAR